MKQLESGWSAKVKILNRSFHDLDRLYRFEVQINARNDSLDASFETQTAFYSNMGKFEETFIDYVNDEIIAYIEDHDLADDRFAVGRVVEL